MPTERQIQNQRARDDARCELCGELLYETEEGVDIFRGLWAHDSCIRVAKVVLYVQANYRSVQTCLEVAQP